MPTRPSSPGRRPFDPNTAVAYSPSRHRPRTPPFNQNLDWLGTPPPDHILYYPPLPVPTRPLTPHPPETHPLAFSVMQDQGSRPYMQDDFIITDSLFGIRYTYLFGIFDGHGEDGGNVSRFIRDRIINAFAPHKQAFSEDPAAVVSTVFRELDASLMDTQDWDVYGSGTCAVLAIVTPDRKLVTANIGDSRAVLGRLTNAKDTYMTTQTLPLRSRVNGLRQGYESGIETTDDDERQKDFAAIPLTIDHTLADDRERERCLAAGARVEALPPDDDDASLGTHPLRLYKGTLPYPGIMITRSFGDFTAKKLGLTPLPQVRIQALDPSRDLCLLLGSDGLFDGMSNRRVVRTCFSVWKAWRKRRAGDTTPGGGRDEEVRGLRRVAHEAAKRILKKCWKEDNVTVMCVLL